MPQKPVNEDSKRLMRMSVKLRKISKTAMTVLVVIVILAGLFYLIQDPWVGVILLICGAIGAGGIYTLKE